ncbi:hypothetical protein V5O48_006636 [Marasmius crinis-equi]|uniref:F-box domain-containing protein n=1 Tax=Marasmius crinis-equi TaxID=585013 RepID=A0ABR3FIY5_9AGAR
MATSISAAEANHCVQSSGETEENDTASSLTRREIISTERIGTNAPTIIIDDFPNELLSEIFILAHASHKLNSPARHPLHPRAQARILRNVSSRWRGVAERTRSIWQDFEITTKGSPCFWTKVEREVLRTLKKHSDSWQYTVLEINRSLIAELSSIHRKISNLERLDLVLYKEFGEWPIGLFANAGPQEVLIDIFSHAPKLKSFTSRGVSPSLETIPWRHGLPWPQLERIDITERHTILESYNFLNGAGSVETICINAPSGRTLFAFNSSFDLPILLPSVRCLFYRHNSRNEGNSILCHLKLPNLVELSVDDAVGANTCLTASQRLLERSIPDLKCMELKCSSRSYVCCDGTEGGWYMKLIDRVRQSLEYLSLDVVLPRRGVKKGRENVPLVLMNNMMNILGNWLMMGLGKLEDLVLMINIGDDVDSETLATCVDDLKNLMRKNLFRRKERWVDITILVYGFPEVTHGIRQEWKKMSSTLGVDEETVVVLQE